ncbi:KamA family radical SAM protein [Clostridium sp. YIM B02505]|uniref:KamA family radical SAM protein n=1 Tax=Clostridium yunnanense TaxID=2800325 RepID=A0ABS1EPM7_9CLOT|nr:KamA family radical SAM protein [Clostridium yunnanense]MBK1811294.1 KamA family radical SAM protein [Clostridium yunnanense]
MIENYEDLRQLTHVLGQEKVEQLDAVTQKYPIKISKHYLSLINLNDPQDPLFKLCIPSLDELADDGLVDTSNETINTVLRGVQHKYPQTVLLLATNQCAVYCRHCFRKRMVGVTTRETEPNMEETVDYIRKNKQITNVLISGGDALLMSTKKIEEYLDNLCSIDHLNYIRFGTRLLVAMPERIINDKRLISAFRKYSAKKQIYIVSQANHPREITDSTKKAAKILSESGVLLRNQSVLLNGVNDNEETLCELMETLSTIGIEPYYLFQCRPVKGAKNIFQVPILKGAQLVDNARKKLDGISKSFRYILSHATGKIEIVGTLEEDKVVFKYHHGSGIDNSKLMFIRKLSHDQSWLQDL